MSKGKDEMRRQLASLNFTEKIKILEKLRDRSRALAATRLRQKAVRNQTGGTKEISANPEKEE